METPGKSSAVQGRVAVSTIVEYTPEGRMQKAEVERIADLERALAKKPRCSTTLNR
jgi:hypothetical protein